MAAVGIFRQQTKVLVFLKIDNYARVRVFLN
jgi:hypothetical protein